MSSIGFIGAGNMATAIIKGIISKNVVNFDNIWVSDIDFNKLKNLKNQYGIHIASDNSQLANSVDILILSVKPQVMQDVLEGLKGGINNHKIIVSIAAGVKIEKITEILGDLPVIRVMPNTPALVGAGIAGIFANKQAQQHLDKVKRIFSAVGKAIVVQNENLIDAVTAVSGSGPAYFFLMMEKMIEAAMQLGLEENIARELVLQTAKGSAQLAIESHEAPDVLRKRVTSPGGTTQAALEVFADMNFDKAVIEAIKRAAQRSIELSK